MEWDELSLTDLGALAALATLIFVVGVQVKPAVNRWAARRCLLWYAECRAVDLLTDEQLRSRPRWRREWWRRFRRNQQFRFFRLLTTRSHRFSQDAMITQVWDVLERPVSFELYPSGCEPLVAEAVLLQKRREKKCRDKRLVRVHRRIVCAGECGTRYGKRRHDHNFFGGPGIEGGWRCPSPESCLERPTGDHFCGMCERELRHSSMQVAGTEVVQEPQDAPTPPQGGA